MLSKLLYITSPIAGGYNISEVQVNDTATSDVRGHIIPNLPNNIIQSLVVTTYGNTTVSAGQTTSGALLKLSIVNNGTAQTIALNTPVTLSHGEVVELTSPQMTDNVGGIGNNILAQTLTETVTDAATGGAVAMSATYFELFDGVAGNPPYINISVVATNVVLGGELVTTALADDLGVPGIPCLSSPLPATPSPAPSCLLPTSEMPNPHPTQNSNASPGCTS